MRPPDEVAQIALCWLAEVDLCDDIMHTKGTGLDFGRSSVHLGAPKEVAMHIRRHEIFELYAYLPSMKSLTVYVGYALFADMPPRKQPAGDTGGLHKSTINFPTDLYEDLRLLAALEPGGSMNALLERAARDLVERERETLTEMKRLAAKRDGRAREREARKNTERTQR